MKEERETQGQVIHALGLLLKFMDSMRVAESTMKLAQYKEYTQSILKASHLVLDAAALQSLEILHTGVEQGSKEAGKVKEAEVGSLFYFINYTRTPFGKRLLRRWICSPLTDIKAINERLDAVEELLGQEHSCGKVSDLLGAIKDLESKTVRAYEYSVKQKVSAVYF